MFTNFCKKLIKMFSYFNLVRDDFTVYLNFFVLVVLVPVETSLINSQIFFFSSISDKAFPILKFLAGSKSFVVNVPLIVVSLGGFK